MTLKLVTKLMTLVFAMLLITSTPVAANHARSRSIAPARAVAAKTTTARNSAGTGSATATVEQTLFRLLNQERTQRGLSALQSDTTLVNLAQMKSRDMVMNRYFNHTSPTYGSPAQMLTRYGVSYRQFAENIAKGGEAARIHAQWMASPGHRANILNAQLSHVGIGVAEDGAGYAATQIFIAR